MVDKILELIYDYTSIDLSDNDDFLIALEDIVKEMENVR